MQKDNPRTFISVSKGTDGTKTLRHISILPVRREYPLRRFKDESSYFHHFTADRPWRTSWESNAIQFSGIVESQVIQKNNLAPRSFSRIDCGQISRHADF